MSVAESVGRLPVGLGPRRRADRLAPGGAVRFLGVDYVGDELPASAPPRLFVVVDTEEEFDWSAPFARDKIQVTAMAVQERAQAVFDRHGVRPIYVIDYPVASQPEGYQPLLPILRRGGCEIGAHLHPWTNPPFDEEVSERNSFPGNLAPAVEAAKFDVLLETIEANLGVRPRFYKAGRFGIGPHTVQMLRERGIAVDLSLLPGASYADTGGPDFRGLAPMPYRVGDGALLSLPMTRGHVGALGRFEMSLNPALDAPIARALRLRGLLSRLMLFHKVTLSPEGASTAELTALIAALAGRGVRSFVMFYHSPSLVHGNTPYVRTDADAAALIARIDAVCGYFTTRLGGRIGDPAELLPVASGARTTPARNRS